MKIMHQIATSILTPTDGFLGGEGAYTQTLNPAIGCSFGGGGCGDFCYAAQGMAHRMNSEGYAWGDYVKVKRNAPELLRRELARAARRKLDHTHHVSKLAGFASSSTDPCAGPIFAVFRECLEVVRDFSVRKFVVQTCSPAVVKLRREIEELGPRGVVSFTIETDSDEVWGVLQTKGSPSVARRKSAFEAMSDWTVALHLAISPCLKLTDPVSCADWVARYADYATVDTFVAGDGSEGRRTARSKLPEQYAEQGWSWQDETGAKELLKLLQARMGDRAAWSKTGFCRLASL